MNEPMATWVEVWPVAADKRGIWLVSGVGAWNPALPVAADSSPHAEVELLLAENGALTDATLIHATSWRHDPPRQVDSYMVILDTHGDYVRARWPQAAPVDLWLPVEVGRPSTHAANEPPAPRHVDVLLHGLRHLRFLRDEDGTAAAAMSEDWRRHLDAFTPALACMYSDVHPGAVAP